MLPELKPIPDDLSEEERAKIRAARQMEGALTGARAASEAMIKATALATFYKKLANEQRDPEYFGTTVKPGDPKGVLLKWRVDNGRYRVIYGDLRADTVDAAD
jgi:hypothetical protein